jgi:hypothetical protein
MSKYRIAFLIWLTVVTVVAATITTIYAFCPSCIEKHAVVGRDDIYRSLPGQK